MVINKMKLSNKKTFSLILMVFAWILSLNVASLPQDIWTPELQMKVKSFGSLSVSPDGKKVAYTITDAVMTADKSEMNTQIFLGDLSGNNRQITSGEKSSTTPKWSPDGKKFAFLSNRKDNRNYIYLINPETNEIIQLTETKTSISAFEWSPDGNFIAFTMSDAKTPEEEINDKAKSDHRWIDEVVKQTRLYLIEIGSEISQIKPVPLNLTPGNMSVSSDFNWSPDGRKIAFSHSRSQRIDDWKSLDISVVDINEKKIQTLVATPTAEFAPFFSPDGKNIAFVMNDDPPHWAQKSAIYIVSASGGGKPRLLTETANNLPTISGWSGDGKQIFFYELNKTAVKIYSLDAASKRVAEVNLQDDEVYQNITLNRAGEVFGFTRSYLKNSFLTK